eukprot:538750_1
MNNTSIFQNTVNQPSPTIPTPTQMTSKYSFPTPNQMNPMLPSVLTPVHTATTPKTTNPFDSAMVANGLNFTVQQIVAAQKANAGTPKGATSTSPLNQLNPSNNSLTNLQNITHGSSASLDISHSGSLGNLQMGSLAALRSSSADNLLNALNNPGTPRNTVSTPKNNTPNNNTPHTPTLATAPSLPALQPTTSVGSLLSFRGLSDPLSNLASGLPRMHSSGLFLPTVHRENSIPQVPTTPNITRNISELSLLSQGNSHFVPYGGATGYFEPPTPSQNDGTQTPTITTPNLATNNNSSGPYAQFQYTMNIQQQQNKLKQINNNTITNVNKPVDNSNKPVVTDNKKDIINNVLQQILDQLSYPAKLVYNPQDIIYIYMAVIKFVMSEEYIIRPFGKSEQKQIQTIMKTQILSKPIGQFSTNEIKQIIDSTQYENTNLLNNNANEPYYNDNVFGNIMSKNDNIIHGNGPQIISQVSGHQVHIIHNYII